MFTTSSKEADNASLRELKSHAEEPHFQAFLTSRGYVNILSVHRKNAAELLSEYAEYLADKSEGQGEAGTPRISFEQWIFERGQVNAPAYVKEAMRRQYDEAMRDMGYTGEPPVPQADAALAARDAEEWLQDAEGDDGQPITEAPTLRAYIAREAAACTEALGASVRHALRTGLALMLQKKIWPSQRTPIPTRTAERYIAAATARLALLDEAATQPWTAYIEAACTAALDADDAETDWFPVDTALVDAMTAKCMEGMDVDTRLSDLLGARKAENQAANQNTAILSPLEAERLRQENLCKQWHQWRAALQARAKDNSWLRLPIAEKQALYNEIEAFAKRLHEAIAPTKPASL